MYWLVLMLLKTKKVEFCFINVHTPCKFQQNWLKKVVSSFNGLLNKGSSYISEEKKNICYINFLLGLFLFLNYAINFVLKKGSME